MQGLCLAAVIFGRKIGLPECGIFSAREKHGILRVVNRNLLRIGMERIEAFEQMLFRGENDEKQ